VMNVKNVWKQPTEFVQNR